MPNASQKRSLPLIPHPDHLRKQAKARLADMRAKSPVARLSDAQLVLANEYGFASWSALQAAVAGCRKGPGSVHASIRPVTISILEQRPAAFADPDSDAPMRLFPAWLGAQICVAVVVLVAWAAAALPILVPHGPAFLPQSIEVPFGNSDLITVFLTSSRSPV